MVEVELLDPIKLARLALPSQPPLETRKDTGRGIPEQALLVGVGDVAVRVLREGELAVQLLERDAVVGEVEEAVVLDGGLGQGDEVGDDGRIRRVEEGEVDGVDVGPVEVLLGGLGRDPGRDGRFAGGGG